MAAGAMSTQLGSGARETRRSGALRRGRASHCAGAAAPARAEKRAVKKKQALLLKSVEGLGNEGELVDVKLGYLRNYLVPQRLATAATQDIIEQKREEERKREEARRQKKAEAEDLARALRTIGTFSVTKKAGENNKIFGRVSAEDITAAIKEQIDQDLKKESLSLPEIRELGDFNVTATLHPEVKAQFTVRCQPAKGGRRGAE